MPARRCKYFPRRGMEVLQHKSHTKPQPHQTTRCTSKKKRVLTLACNWLKRTDTMRDCLPPGTWGNFCRLPAPRTVVALLFGTVRMSARLTHEKGAVADARLRAQMPNLHTHTHSHTLSYSHTLTRTPTHSLKHSQTHKLTNSNTNSNTNSQRGVGSAPLNSKHNNVGSA